MLNPILTFASGKVIPTIWINNDRSIWRFTPTSCKVYVVHCGLDDLDQTDIRTLTTVNGKKMSLIVIRILGVKQKAEPNVGQTQKDLVAALIVHNAPKAFLTNQIWKDTSIRPIVFHVKCAVKSLPTKQWWKHIINKSI